MLLYWCPYSPAAEGWMPPRFPPATVTSRHPSPYPPPASPCSPNTLHQKRPLRHVFNNIETPKNLSVPSLRAHVELHLCPQFLFNKAFVPLVLEFGGLKECRATVYAAGLHARQSRPQRKEQATASRGGASTTGPSLSQTQDRLCLSLGRQGLSHPIVAESQHTHPRLLL